MHTKLAQVLGDPEQLCKLHDLLPHGYRVQEEAVGDPGHMPHVGVNCAPVEGSNKLNMFKGLQ